MSLAVSRKSVKQASTSFVADLSETGQVIEHFFSSLDTPRSLAACLLYKYGEHAQLLDLDVNPDQYLQNNIDVFHRDYLAVSFLSKLDSLEPGYDKKERGITKFLKFEEQCKETNQRFKSCRELENSQYALWLFTMRRKIDLILGDFVSEELFDQSAWGPGVSTLIKGSDTSATRKFQSEVGITYDAYALLGSSLASAYPGWFREERLGDSSVLIQQGNSVTTVPKNSKTDRVIAIEPGLNLYFQKGIGSMIKRRLRRFGVDLTSQQRNQVLARRGSLMGDLATVDFSSASDSIARNLVRHLLPLRWYTVMDALRSKNGSFEGREFTWEKFSSMGNGFTFELESLIFYAAALTVCEFKGTDTSDVSVYGDDVIVPTHIFEPYRDFCDFLGFTVNTEKSFFSGFFRESCGSHFFRGLDVKPIFLKKNLSDASSLFKLANSIRRLSHRRSNYCGCDRRFLATWRRVLQGLPAALRGLKIPEGFGDGGILSNFDEACPPRALFGHEGFNVLTLDQRSVLQHQDCHGLLQERLTQVTGSGFTMRSPCGEFLVHPSPMTKRLMLEELKRGFSDLGYGNNTSLRGRTRVSVSEIRVLQWYNLGEWI